MKDLIFDLKPEPKKSVSHPIFSRIVVLDVIYDPTTITPERVAYYRDKLELDKPEYLDIAPRNTVVGRRILDGTGNFSSPTRLFFPFFPPHLSLPCMPGEHMWALVSENEFTAPEYGYWFCRITEPWHVDDLNHTHSPRGFEPSFKPSRVDKATNNDKPIFDFANGKVIIDPVDKSRRIQDGSQFITGGPRAYEELIESNNQINASALVPKETVPRYKKRPGDFALEGTNNTLIVLGTDRSGPASDSKLVDYKSSKNEVIKVLSPEIPKSDTQKGVIDIVAGRGNTPETLGDEVTNTMGYKELNKFPPSVKKTEGDPDTINDASRVRVSSKTRTDKNFQLSNFNIDSFSIEDSPDGDPSVVIKSDKIRLIARKDVEILVNANDSTSTDGWAAIVIKSNGDIVLKPSKEGYIKLGGDDADRGIVCTDSPVTAVDGIVNAPSIVTTMGGLIAGSAGGNPILGTGLGTFANRVLIK